MAITIPAIVGVVAIDIPEDCAIRVGNETHIWQQGKLMIFDDSFEHEAWNKSNENRIVFIFEIWHPELSKIEIEGLQTIMTLQNKLNQNQSLKHIFLTHKYVHYVTTSLYYL